MERNRWRQDDSRRREREPDYSEFIDEYDQHQQEPPAFRERERYRRESQAPDDYVDYRERSPRPSNYSDGGHTRRHRSHEDERGHRLRRRDNYDNRDFELNRDFERGSDQEYRGYEARRERTHDWSPRDSYEAERLRNGYRHSYEARHPELDRHYDRHFEYRYGSDDIDFDSREERPAPSRRHRPRHRSGY